jgi:hypothetical protein
MKMKKSMVMRAITSLCLVVGLCAGLVPAGTAHAETQAGGGVRFYYPNICVLKHKEAAEWQVQSAASHFVTSNVSLVTRDESKGQNCNDYAFTQILHVRDGNFGSTGACVPRKDGTGFYHDFQNASYAYGYSDGPNPTYSSVTVYLNNANRYCFDTVTKRENTTSKGIGIALGLSTFSTPTDPSVMYDSPYSNARVPWATVYDRTNLYYLYQ